MFPCRPIGLLVREPDLTALHGGQQKGSVAGFGKMTVGSNHGVIVLNGPQAIVEQPVDVLGGARPLSGSLLSEVKCLMEVVSDAPAGYHD